MATTPYSVISSYVLQFTRHLVHQVENYELGEDPSERLSELLDSGEILYGHLERIIHVRFDKHFCRGLNRRDAINC